MMFYKKSSWCGDHVHRLLSNTFYVAQLIEKQRTNGGIVKSQDPRTFKLLLWKIAWLQIIPTQRIILYYRRNNNIGSSSLSYVHN